MKKIGKALALLTVFSFLWWGVSCSHGSSGSGSDVTPSETEVTVSSVTISGSASVAVGKTVQLSAAVTMSDESTFDGTVTWKSSSSSVATVSDSGLVTGVAAGKASITATAGGVSSAAFEVTVTEVEENAITAVTVSGSTSISCNGTAELTASATTTGSVTPVYTWEITSGADYANLSATTGANVTLTANNTTESEQSVVVTVTATDETDTAITASKTHAITIAAQGVTVVDEVTAVSILSDSASIAADGSASLTAVAESTGSPSITYTWEITSGSDCATLSATEGASVTLTGNNESESDQTVTVLLTASDGTNSVSDSMDIIVAALVVEEEIDDDTPVTLTWDFTTDATAAVTMYSDEACATAIDGATIQYGSSTAAGPAYLLGATSGSTNLAMYVETPVSGSKIGIRSTSGDVQVNAGALFYIPVSNGSVVTVMQKSATSNELGGTSDSSAIELTYTASAAGYVLYEAIAQVYLTKIEVTDVVVSDSHTSDVVSFTAQTDSTTENSEDVLGFVAASVESSDTSIATAAIADGAIAITSVAPSAASAARTTTITATGSDSETTSWTVTVSRYGNISLGEIEPYVAGETTVTVTYFDSTLSAFSAAGTSSDTDVVTAKDAVGASTLATPSTAFGTVNSVKSHYYQIASVNPASGDTILTVTLSLTAVNPITIKSVKGDLNESATDNISRTVKIGSNTAVSLGSGKAVTCSVSDIGYHVDAGDTVSIVFTTTATADATSKTFKQLFKDIVITAIVEDTTPSAAPTVSFLNAGGDVTVTCSTGDSGYTFTATAPDSTDSYTYAWYIDNTVQSGETGATLTVSSLSAGVHSIVVQATEESTGVVYASQYMLTISE